ncbi:hypothetical protein BX666DRAFT_603132 [Dichotomocladium elegans]|nr:hypothetical protein BX666DRAFT_603132 [Dichotomocladium elegans]
MRPSSSYSLRCTTISFSEKHRTSCRRCNAAQSDDFFRKLPYEVIILIFKNVHFPDIVECLNVSNSWNKSLSGCFELWRDMTISDSCHAFAIQPWIPDIHCHVQELTFSFADATTLSRTLGFIAAGYFEQLRSLQIYSKGSSPRNN